MELSLRPLVKRRDEVGETWLYLPRGTKTLTLKHPQWRVLRDYPLGMKLESRMTYEMPTVHRGE